MSLVLSPVVLATALSMVDPLAEPVEVTAPESEAEAEAAAAMQPLIPALALYVSINAGSTNHAGVSFGPSFRLLDEELTPFVNPNFEVEVHDIPGGGGATAVMGLSVRTGLSYGDPTLFLPYFSVYAHLGLRAPSAAGEPRFRGGVGITAPALLAFEGYVPTYLELSVDTGMDRPVGYSLRFGWAL